MAGLREGSAMSALTKMHVFVLQVKCQQTYLFESHANHSFDFAMEQTLRSHNLTYFLENIIKSAWYVLPPGGMSACRKWIVCTDLKKGTCIFV